MNLLLRQTRKWQRKALNAVVRNSPALGLGLDQRAEDFVGLFENDIPAKSRVLDIGGAWGFYSAPLRRRGHHVTVLDVARPDFQQCPVVLYDGDRIPFPDKSFEASLLVTVLHHVPDPEALLLEACRVTRNVLVVVEDLYHHGPGRWWTVFRDQLLNFEFFGHPKNFKTGDEWLDTFTRAGFHPCRDFKVFTWLAGFRILNGVFVLNTNAGSGNHAGER